MPRTFSSADGTPTSINLSKIIWSSVGVGLLLIITAVLVIFKWQRRKKRKSNHPPDNQVSRDFSCFHFCFVLFVSLFYFFIHVFSSFLSLFLFFCYSISIHHCSQWRGLVMNPSKHQRSKQTCQDLCSKGHDRSQYFVLRSYTMHDLCNQNVSTGQFLGH